MFLSESPFSNKSDEIKVSFHQFQFSQHLDRQVYHGQKRTEGRCECSATHDHVLRPPHPGQDLQGGHGQHQEEGGVRHRVDGLLHQIQD